MHTKKALYDCENIEFHIREFSRVPATTSVEKQQTKLSERYLVATAATARVSLRHPVTQGKYCFGEKKESFSLLKKTISSLQI